jgi:hypothetical protein
VARIVVTISNGNDIEAEDVSSKSLYFTLACLKIAKKYNTNQLRCFSMYLQRGRLPLFFRCIYSEGDLPLFSRCIYSERVSLRLLGARNVRTGNGIAPSTRWLLGASRNAV